MLTFVCAMLNAKVFKFIFVVFFTHVGIIPNNSPNSEHTSSNSPDLACTSGIHLQTGIQFSLTILLKEIHCRQVIFSISLYVLYILLYKFIFKSLNWIYLSELTLAMSCSIFRWTYWSYRRKHRSCMTGFIYGFCLLIQYH